MNILFIIDLLAHMGGAERNICQLATELKKRGHHPVVACFNGGETSRSLLSQGVNVHDLAINRVYGWSGLRGIRYLYGLVQEQEINVIVTYHKGSDYIGLLVAALTRRPVLSNRRDMGYQLKPRDVIVYRLLNKFFSRIITVSSAVKEVIVATQKTSAEKVSVIYNGVDTSLPPLFSDDEQQHVRESLGIPPESQIVCCIANLRPIKGQKYFIESIKLLKERFSAVHFLMIGDHEYFDNSDYYAELQKIIKEHSLEKFITFTGKVEPAEVPKWIHASDISVLSSLSEGFSNTILETMAAGKPVIATAVGGNPEIVINGKTGLLVPPKDSVAFSEALFVLLSDKKLRDKMGEIGRSLIENKFSLSRMINQYEDLLQSVIFM